MRDSQFNFLHKAFELRAASGGGVSGRSRCAVDSPIMVRSSGQLCKGSVLRGSERWMEEVRDKVYRQETVRLDGKLFYNCSFEDCLLCYGGERCEWENTKFANCRVVLDGSANNTVQVLQGFGFQVILPNLV